MASFPRPAFEEPPRPVYNEPAYENPRPTRRQAPARSRPSNIGLVAVIVWCLLAGLAVLVGAASVGAFAGLTDDLPDPKTLEDAIVQQESVIYDRTGQIELARVGQTHRDVVTFDEIPPIVIDAQTAVEDKTFWENAGFDPMGFVSAAIDTLQGNDRGGSTITQQLVRNRLLPSTDIEPGT
jgi:membrane peptidoglycan carboxypeptidase